MNQIENPQDPEAWVERYEAIRPKIVKFKDKLKTLITDVLESEGLGVHIIEGRAKDTSSFKEKISRPNKKYGDPLVEMTDLCGLRVITYYADEVDRVCSLLRREFVEVPGLSVDLRDQSPDQFGYSSVHLILKMKSGRAKLAEWKEFRGMVIEVQVRSVLQHAWAAISHALQYKREASVPVHLRRRLNRLSGLLELADEEFEELRHEQAALKKDVRKRIKLNQLDIEANEESVRHFLSTSPLTKEIGARAKAAGFQVRVTVPGGEGVASLCRLVGIDSISELERVLRQSMTWNRSFFKFLVREERKKGTAFWQISPEFGALMILIASRYPRIQAKDLLSMGWDRTSTADILELANRFGRAT